MVVKLNNSVKLVNLQFSFSNVDAIPPSLISIMKPLVDETPRQSNDRRLRYTGRRVINPTEKCSLLTFIGELETSGYNLAEAFYQERLDPKDRLRKRKYHMVRFVFSRNGFVQNPNLSGETRKTARSALYVMCSDAMWRVRAFLNPFFKEHEPVAGQFVVSVNNEARKPLFNPVSGEPEMVWQKDGNGARVGNEKILLRPEYKLRVVNGDIKLGRLN